MSKVVEANWKLGMARRSGFNSSLEVGYGLINILKIASVFKVDTV